MNFITKHVSVVSSMENLETSDAIPLNQIDFQNNFKLSRGKIGDIIQCDEFFVYDDYKIYRGIHIKQDNMAIPVEGSRHLSIEKTLCFETRIYIVTTPKKHKEEFIIKAFDYEGRNTEHLKFLVPSRKWQGVPRKPLIYFNPSINKIDIGIQEFGVWTVPPVCGDVVLALPVEYGADRITDQAGRRCVQCRSLGDYSKYLAVFFSSEAFHFFVDVAKMMSRFSHGKKSLLLSR